MGSETHYARAFDHRGIEYSKKPFKFSNTEAGFVTFKEWMGKKLGVEKVHPHKFRRTMATRAIEKGVPIEQVQKILGHEQIDTTLRYAMVNQNNVKLSHRKYIS